MKPTIHKTRRHGYEVYQLRRGKVIITERHSLNGIISYLKSLY